MLQWIILYIGQLTHVQVCPKGKFLRLVLLGQRVCAFVVLIDVANLPSIGIELIYIPVSSKWGHLFSHSLAHTVLTNFLSFDNLSIFLTICKAEDFFKCLSLYFLLSELSIHILCSFFSCWSFSLCLVGAFSIQRRLTLAYDVNCSYFPVILC